MEAKVLCVSSINAWACGEVLAIAAAVKLWRLYAYDNS